MTKRSIVGLLLVLGCGLISCKKYQYSLQGDIPNAAYLRVFNDIPFTATYINQNQPVPFFTLLIDPQIGPNGIPTGSAAVVGDYLGTRQIFNPSTPINEGNGLNVSLDTTIKYNINYEYPGNAHVLAAPPMNGYDVSAWAQITSGKHRFLFVSRPQNNTPFASLSDSIRRRVLIDTTLTLQAGELYTMEALLMNIDASLYGVYLRQEDFMKQPFDSNKYYISFYNLSSAKSVFSDLPQSPTSGYFPDTLNVSYTYYAFQNAGSPTAGNPFLPLYGYNNNFIASINGRLQTSASYAPLPLLSNDNFYDAYGNLRSQTDTTYYTGGGLGTNNYYVAQLNWGTMPYFVFNFGSSSGNIGPTNGGQYPYVNEFFQLNCFVDPVQINNYSQFQLLGVNQGQNGVVGTESMANLNMLVTQDNQTYVYPAVYIVELVNYQAFVMQIQKKL